MKQMNRMKTPIKSLAFAFLATLSLTAFGQDNEPTTDRDNEIQTVFKTSGKASGGYGALTNKLGNTGIVGHVYMLPHWFLVLLLAIYPARIPLRWIFRHALARDRSTKGLCPQCGYDLRSTPTRCPECGFETRRLAAI